MENQGAEIVVIAPLDKYINYLNQFDSVRHIPLKKLHRKSVNPYYDFKLFQEFAQIYKKEKPDLVLHFTIKPNIFGNLAAKFCNIPSICAVTGLGYAFLHNGWVERISTWLYRFSFSFAKKVIFENQDDRTLFIEKKIIKAEQGIAIKGCGIDLNHYKPLLPENKPKNKIIFTFIGRLLYDKGILEFVEAAKIIKKRHTNVQFWVVGEIDKENPATASEEQLLEWVNEKTIIEWGPSADVRQQIRNSDCIVLPSYSEGSPRVLQEAIGMARPIIATDVAGCREIVQEGENGFLCKVKDVNSLVGGMEKFIQLSENQQVAMGKKGRVLAEKYFDEKIIAQFYIDIFHDIYDKK